MKSLRRMVFLQSLLIVLLSTEATALDVADKKPFAQFEEILKAEGQVEVARAKYVLNAEDPTLMKVLCVKFTMNSAGNGYVLMSDDMDDERAHTELVYAKLKNAFIYDPHTLSRLPSGVSRESELGRLIEQVAATGDGVLLHGESIKRMTDGSETAVGLLTVMANVSGSNNRLVNNRVAILITNRKSLTRSDKVVATSLFYNANLVHQAQPSRP